MAHLNNKFSSYDFSKLSSAFQDNWLSNKLKELQRALEDDGYKVFLFRFNTAYNRAKSDDVTVAAAASGSEEGRGAVYRSLARRVLFGCIRDAEANLQDLISERNSKRHFNALAEFNNALREIVTSPERKATPPPPPTPIVHTPENRSHLLDDIIEAIQRVERYDARPYDANSRERVAMESSQRFKKALRFLKHGSTADTLMMAIGGESWLLRSPPNRDEYRRTLQAAVKAKALPVISLGDLESVLD